MPHSFYFAFLFFEEFKWKCQMELKKWNISNLESLAYGRVLAVC